ncbi:MAG: cytochrome c biogenesis protein CcsA [Opitutaceae bacterium]|nr:cytochrome c biogenesis protein CcsA [Cytophagales bacterium]
MRLALSWWKILCIVLLFYTIIAGFLFEVPRRFILNESIRNLYFHVPMWFGMIFLLLASASASVLYLKNGKQLYDIYASQSANAGIVFGTLGLLTGMLWAKYTWGAYWSGDPKQNASAIGMLIYLAYFVLRGSIDDLQKKARISAVYNIFAFAMLVPLLFVLPRLTDSLHPGNGGNPGFNAYDLDSKMRLVFYPAIIGWTLLGFWLTDINTRIETIKHKLDYE